MAASVAVTPFVVEDNMNNVSPSTGRPDASSAAPAHASMISSPFRYAATWSPISGPSSTSDWRASCTCALALEDVADSIFHHIHAFKTGVVVRRANDRQQEPVACDAPALAEQDCVAQAVGIAVDHVVVDHHEWHALLGQRAAEDAFPTQTVRLQKLGAVLGHEGDPVGDFAAIAHVPIVERRPILISELGS